MRHTALSLAIVLGIAGGIAAAQRTAKPAGATAGTLPVNTPLELQLETHLDTRDLKHGDGFAARVLKPVYFENQLAIPAGAIIEGHVAMTRDERPALGHSELLLLPDLLALPDGRKFTISAVLAGNDPLNPAKVNSEGMLEEPRGVLTADLHHAELGGGAGLVGGLLLAGAHGAALGGGVGAGVAATLWLVRVRHLDMTPGTRFTITLDRALELHAVAAPAPTEQR